MRRRARARLLGAVLALVVLANGCAGGAAVPPPPGGAAAVRIASFDFPESRILAELYAQALEAGGVEVARHLSLGSRELVEPALEQGVVDLVPEYAGSALRFLGAEAGSEEAGPQVAADHLSRMLARRGIAVLEPSMAQNRNTVVVTAETATEHDLRNVSDLGPFASRWTLGGPIECPERPSCLIGLEERYGLTFGDFEPLEASRYVTAALEEREIEVGVLFTTDPQLAGDDLVELTDDRGLQPPEFVVPVVRREVLDRYGMDLRGPLDAVSAALDTAALVELNRQVELEGQEPERVAGRWLERHGLLS